MPDPLASMDTVEPSPPIEYLLTAVALHDRRTPHLGLDWREVTANRCDTVRDDSLAVTDQGRVPGVRRLVQRSHDGAAWPRRACRGIAVACLDRGAIEADSRPLAPDEGDRLTYLLDSYDQHVCDSGEVNAAFLDQIFAAAGVERFPDEDTDNTDARRTVQ
ncbi:hypothetical protein [Dactylosporangium sp. NPDC049140]|uniref:hypothetical protein n=1 Tax=Dactylosporangium sp. NPDC049140 TaxID=3155647 RepID=UPI00340D9237